MKNIYRVTAESGDQYTYVAGSADEARQQHARRTERSGDVAVTVEEVSE